MFFRHMFTRSARPCWRMVSRGKKNLPVWRPPNFPDCFHGGRPSFFEEPWFRGFGGPYASGSRMSVDMFREHMRRMEEMFKSSPWRMMKDSEPCARSKHAEVVEAKLGKDGLHLEMNLSPFEADDIAVKMSGQRLVVTGKHSSKPDEHGFVAREFTREFLVPEEIDTESLCCRLTDEGHLVITAKVKGELETSREIKIEHEASQQKESTDKEQK